MAIGKNVILLLLLSFTWSMQKAAAQQGGSQDFVKNSLNDVAIVGWSGAGGALLGLSTLSFVDTPKDHLKNIYVGASIGIIIGVAVVAYLQANKAQSQYTGNGSAYISPIINVESVEKKDIEQFKVPKKVALGLGWTLPF